MARFSQAMAKRVDQVADAWAKLRPFKSFFGMSLEDFRKILKPFMDARAELAELQVQMQHAVLKREAALNAAARAAGHIVDAVRGDPDEGDDGPLYAAMGYIPKNRRSTGLMRRRPDDAVLPDKSSG